MSCSLLFAAQRSSTKSVALPNEGQKTFSAVCASCHGLDGRGSERAPDIVKRKEVQRLSDSDLIGIVRDGVPGTGMPAFHSLPTLQIKAVVAYLRALQGNNTGTKLPGDPTHGEILFDKAGCSDCHMVAGKGGFIAADLSGYGHLHSLTEIRKAIGHARQIGGVVISTVEGHTYSGRIRNEDNFSLQLQTPDGAFHFFDRSQIARIENSPKPLVGSDYSSTLNSKEVDDIASYLMKSSRSQGSHRSEIPTDNDE